MTMQVSIPANALSVINTEPFFALTFTTKATLREIPQLGYVPSKLYAEAERLGLIPHGPVQYLYTGVSGDESNVFELKIVLPIAATAILSDTFVLETIAPFRCVSYTFAGPWEAFPTMYDSLFASFYQAGYQTNRLLREVYRVVDLESPEKCVTEIQVGIA